MPPPPIRELRDLTRYRTALIQERTREVQRLHKVLEDAGVKLSSVASHVLGVSGRLMIEALVQGTHDPAVLAELAKGRLRQKLPALREALEGHFRAHHALIAGELLAHIDYLDEAIARLSAEVQARIVPFSAAVALLDTMPGVDQRAAEVIVAETGADMTRFPSHRHLAFALTFLGALPVIVTGIDLSHVTFSSSIPLMVGLGIEVTAYAPTLAAIAVAGLLPGESGVRRLLRPVLRWRVAPFWYGVALGGPIVLLLLASGAHVALGGVAPSTWISLTRGADLAFLFGALVAGSFGEEVGWRGFALPRLMQRYTALFASLIVGALWATWHIWPVITPGGAASTTWLVVAETYVRLISTSIIYTWIFNSTGGSVLLVMLAHAGHNLANNIVVAPPTSDTDFPLLVALAYLSAAIVVLIVAGHQTLMGRPWRPAKLRGSTQAR